MRSRRYIHYIEENTPNNSVSIIQEPDGCFTLNFNSSPFSFRVSLASKIQLKLLIDCAKTCVESVDSPAPESQIINQLRRVVTDSLEAQANLRLPSQNSERLESEAGLTKIKPLQTKLLSPIWNAIMGFSWRGSEIIAIVAENGVTVYIDPKSDLLTSAALRSISQKYDKVLGSNGILEAEDILLTREEQRALTKIQYAILKSIKGNKNVIPTDIFDYKNEQTQTTGIKPLKEQLVKMAALFRIGSTVAVPTIPLIQSSAQALVREIPPQPSSLELEHGKLT